MNYQVLKEHHSNYPNPITLAKGQSIKLGKTYDGPENWRGWIYCYAVNKMQEGWVPKQIIQANEEFGVVLEDYTAKELNVGKGEEVVGLNELNGWVWCQKVVDGEVGWVPKENLAHLGQKSPVSER